MSRCAGCQQDNATTLITATNYAAHTCHECRTKLRREAARAGPPVTEKPIGDHQEQPQLLQPQLF